MTGGRCDEQDCDLLAEETRMFTTKTNRARLTFELCQVHDRWLDQGAPFEVVSELVGATWEQRIAISPFVAERVGPEPG